MNFGNSKSQGKYALTRSYSAGIKPNKAIQFLDNCFKKYVKYYSSKNIYL